MCHTPPCHVWWLPMRKVLSTGPTVGRHVEGPRCLKAWQACQHKLYLKGSCYQAGQESPRQVSAWQKPPTCRLQRWGSPEQRHCSEAQEMSCVHPQTLASQARASPAYTPRLEFTLPARQRPLGWRRLISLSLGAYLPSLPPAASRVGLEKGKVPAPRPHQFPAT